MRRLLAPFLIIIFAVQSAAEEPKPYSVNRYNLLWQTDVFQKPAPRPVQKSATVRKADSEPEWSVAGVYSIDGKHGAVIINNESGAIEQIGDDYVSPSGITLTKVYSTATGQLPRIEVRIDGDRVVISGNPKKKPAAKNVASKGPSQAKPVAITKR